MFKHHYSRFLAADPNRLHFAAHSHHFWPDVTREAVLGYWDDSARMADKKWDWIFSEVIPKAQRRIAAILDLDQPQQIAFAPNTHEFVARLLSVFDWSKPLRVLTTDAEFHSFTRQINRLAELDNVTVRRIPAMPFQSFEERFKKEVGKEFFDLVFVSQVFFDSGYIIDDLPGFVDGVSSDRTMIVIDGYHGFCSIPTSLGEIQHRTFYLGGGYKYGQSGEGVCFLSVPPGCDLRPMNTGWFAAFEGLDNEYAGPVSYADDAFRFFGATFDPSGLYRFNAVMDWMIQNGLTVAAHHAYVMQLEDYFLDAIQRFGSPLLNAETQLSLPSSTRAHFITYRLPNAAEVAEQLAAMNIIVDSRKDRLRFGFGLYQSPDDIDRLFERLKKQWRQRDPLLDGPVPAR